MQWQIRFSTMASQINLNINDNGFRASKLLIDGGGYLTKQIILQKAIKGTITNMDEFLAEKNVKITTNNLKRKNILKGSQSDILYPTNGSPTNLDDWDITLSTLILNNCFTLNSAEDNAVKDIRRLRNTLYGHTAKVEMTDAEFLLKWTDISTTLTTHSTLFTDPNSITFIKDMIIRILKETLSADKTIQTLKEWYEWGMEVEDKIEEMMEDQKTLFSDAEAKCEVRHRESADQLANIQTNQKRTADDVMSTILKDGKRRKQNETKVNRNLNQLASIKTNQKRTADDVSTIKKDVKRIKQNETKVNTNLDQLASIKTSQTHTANDVSTILKLINRGKRPAVHGTKLNRKQCSSNGENGQDGYCNRNKDLGIPENERRILLIGKTGVGKSTTGNTILGENAFESKVAVESVTNKTEYKKADRYGKSLLIVDTPGLYDTGKTNEEVKVEIAKCHAITFPGLHAIVMVIRVGKFTQEEKNTVELFLQYFGENVTDYMVVVFTHKDSLTNEDETIEQYVERISKNNYLYILLKRINFRYVAFGYKGDSKEREKEVKDLLNIIDEIKETNGGNYYTNEMYKEAEKIMIERWEEEQRRIKEEHDAAIERALNSTREKHKMVIEEIKATNDKNTAEYKQRIEQANIEKEAFEREQKKLLTKMKDEQEKHNRRMEEREIEFRERMREMSEDDGGGFFGSLVRFVKKLF